MQAQACKGKAKLAVLAHELLTLDLSQPTSSIRAAQALQLQREAYITNAARKSRGTYLPDGVFREAGRRQEQQKMAEGRKSIRWRHRQSTSRSYSASAAVAFEIQESHPVDDVPLHHLDDVRASTKVPPSGYGVMNSLETRRQQNAAESDHIITSDQLAQLAYAVRCLNAPLNVRSTPSDVSRLYFDLPGHLQAALPMKQLRQIFRAIAKALLAERDENMMTDLRQGLGNLPLLQFLQRFADASPDSGQLHPNNVNEVLILWIKALLHAEMPDQADRLYNLATSRGHLSSEKLDMDQIVGPLVGLKEWGLVLQWTKGRMCSVGVHAMRMRAFSALGTPHLAIADYEQHEKQLRSEQPTMLEAMKAYYMTRDFPAGNSIRKDLVRQGRTQNHQYVHAMIAVMRYLGFTPLLEKAILKDLRHDGTAQYTVPLLNILIKQRIENGLSISPIIEMYPRAQISDEEPGSELSPILLDQHTLALIMEDHRSLADVAHLRAVWMDMLNHLPEKRISANLIGALVKSLLRIDLWQEAFQLLRDISAGQSNAWVDRPTELHANVFHPLIGHITRVEGFDAATPVFDLMESGGYRPNRKTISALVDGLAQHHLLGPSVRDEFFEDIFRRLPSQFQAGLVKNQLGYGIRTASRNHGLQKEIESLPDERYIGDIPELSNLFEWKHLPRHLEINKTDRQGKPSNHNGSSYWTGSSSPSPSTIFSAAVAKGFPLDGPTCYTILQLYISRGHLARAQEMMLLSWQRGIIPSMEMWRVFVKGLATANQLEFLGRRIDAMRRDASNGAPAAYEAKSMSLAALMPNQVTCTQIIEDLINEGTIRQACQVAKYALTSAAEVKEKPDVGLLAVSFEAFIRAQHTRKARDLLQDPPIGYGNILRAAKGPEKAVLLRALRRARAWFHKYEHVDFASDIDKFLKSIPRSSGSGVIGLMDLPGTAQASVAAESGKHVKRTGYTPGELTGLRDRISRMFEELWPNKEEMAEVQVDHDHYL